MIKYLNLAALLRKIAFSSPQRASTLLSGQCPAKENGQSEWPITRLLPSSPQCTVSLLKVKFTQSKKKKMMRKDRPVCPVGSASNGDSHRLLLLAKFFSRYLSLLIHSNGHIHFLFSLQLLSHQQLREDN